MNRPEQPLLGTHLEDLQRCFDRQLISEAEYWQQRRTLLSAFSALLQSHAPPEQEGVVVGVPSHESADVAAQSLECSTSSDAAEQLPTAASNVWDLPLGGWQTGGHASDHLGEQPDVADSGEFWCSLVRETSRLPGLSPSRRHSEMTMAALQVYDTTAGRVHELFSEYDVNGDGFVSCDELEQGLKQLDLRITSEQVESIFEHMMHVNFIDPGRRKQPTLLTETEFRILLTRLRLAELFTPSAGVFQYQAYSSERFACPTYVCDYNRQHCRVTQFVLGGGEVDTAVQKYFFSRRARWLRGSERVLGSGSLSARLCQRDARWVHIDASGGLDRLTLLRLAVKYGLHPLAVDDVIDNRTSTKLDVFAEHYFVSVDVLALAATEDERRERGGTVRGEDAPPRRVRIHRSNVSMLLNRPPSCDTLVTILQNRSDESSWMAMWRSRDNVRTSPDCSWWAQLREALSQDGRQRMRERRADFLLYEILDRIMDQLRPIAEAYARRLGYMHRHPPWQVPQAWLDELDEVQLELRDLARSIRPMRQVLRHFITDREFNMGVAKMYLEDVEDGIDQMLEDILQLQEMGRTLQEAHEAHRNKRMNTTLFVLSVLSAIFLPAQFVTGLYGMNFVDVDGHPNIPELLWPNGYSYFWCLELFLVCTGVACACLLYFGSADFCSVPRSWCRPCGFLRLPRLRRRGTAQSNSS